MLETYGMIWYNWWDLVVLIKTHSGGGIPCIPAKTRISPPASLIPPERPQYFNSHLGAVKRLDLELNHRVKQTRTIVGSELIEHDEK